ncbi:MAG: P27 family phage terminase small subunit [Ilumatobacteraceae bacterium]
MQVKRKENEIMQPPSPLTARGIEIWNSTIEELRKDGALFETDLSLVCAYSRELAAYEKASEFVELQGEVIETPQGPKVNPWHTVRMKNLKAAQDLARLFGVTPAARKNLQNSDGTRKAGTIKRLDLLKNKKLA